MYTEEDVEEFIRQAQRSSTENTPLNQSRFNNSMQSPSTLSREQYMARAWQRIHNEHPNCSLEELEFYIAQSNYEYEMYSMNSSNATPPVEQLPPLPSQPSPPVSIPLFPPIQVIVSQQTLTEKEREVDVLKPDANLQEFITWQKGARDTLSLVDHFNDQMLIMERSEVRFNSTLSTEQIDQLYKTVWTKIHMATRKICGTNPDIASIEFPYIHLLWLQLRTTFFPTTDQEKYKLEEQFNNMEQGSLSSMEYITKIKDKAYELHIIGIDVPKDKIRFRLLATLSDDTLRHYLFTLSPSLTLNECLGKLLTYGKTMMKDKKQPNNESVPQKVLMVDHNNQSRSDNNILNCHICHKTGHKASECRYNKDNRRIVECAFCHRKGHSEQDCRTKQRVMNKDSSLCYYCNKEGHKVINCRQKQLDEMANKNNINHSQRRYDNKGTNFRNDNNSGYQQSYNRNQINYQNNRYNNDQSRSSTTNYQRLQPRDQRNDSYQVNDYYNNNNRNNNNKRNRDINANNNNINQSIQTSKDISDEQFKKRFRTYITEIMSEQQLPKETSMRAPRLQIEGVPSQHQCGIITYDTTPMEEDTNIRPNAFMIQTIDLEENTSDEEINQLHISERKLELSTLQSDKFSSDNLEDKREDHDITTYVVPEVIDLTGDDISDIEIVNQNDQSYQCWTIRQLEEWALTQDITSTIWESEEIIPELVSSINNMEVDDDIPLYLEEEEVMASAQSRSMVTNTIHNSRTWICNEWIPASQKQKIKMQKKITCKHCNLLPSSTTNLLQRTQTCLTRDIDTQTEISIDDSKLLKETREIEVQTDVSMQETDIVINNNTSLLAMPIEITDNNKQYEEIPLHNVFMITTEEEQSNQKLSSSKDLNPFQKKARQLVKIQIEKHQLEEKNQDLKIKSKESTPTTMCYTINFLDIRKQDMMDSYGVVIKDDLPCASMNYTFQATLEDEITKHETIIRNLGDLVRDRYIEIWRHAIKKKKEYENKYFEYQLKSRSFVFKYDPVKCKPPTPDLEGEDIQYPIQLARYYVTLKINLEEAYRVYKRCTHYKMQAYHCKMEEKEIKRKLEKHWYNKFCELNPYYKIDLPKDTEAYMRAYRNQWFKRLVNLRNFYLYDEYDGPSQPLDLTSLSYDENNNTLSSDIPDLDEDYDPFASDLDDTSSLFPLTNDFIYEQQLQDYITQSDNSDKQLDVTRLDQQDMEGIPYTENTQTYEYEQVDIQPNIPSREDLWEHARQAIIKYRKKRKNTYKNKKKQQKKAKQQQQKQEEDEQDDLEEGEEKVYMIHETMVSKEENMKAEQDILFDSGCTAHMWNHRAHFTTFELFSNTRMKAATAGGHILDILGKGDIGQLKDVLFVPTLKHCLISANALLKQGYGTYNGTVPKVIKEINPSEVLLRGYHGKEMFRITSAEFERQLGLNPVTCFVHEISTQPLLQVHQMLGHASAARCEYECKCNKFPGLINLSSKAFQAIKNCEECALAKANRRSFPGHLDIPEYIGQTWYVDVKGPVATPSLVYDNHYVFGIIDGKTKFLIQYFMKTKDQVLEHFKLFCSEFIPYVRAIQPDLGAITVYSDMGEFHSNAVISFCQQQGILHRTTCAYSPENNGLIERTWRTISEASIAMLLTANLTEPYWEEARRIAGYIKNRIVGGHPSVDSTSPYEKFFGVKPHIKFFKVFGVWAYPRIPVK